MKRPYNRKPLAEGETVNKGGRPRVDKKGAALWVSADILDTVKAFIAELKAQQNNTDKQAKQ
jgi:hypothetical protein